MNTLGRRSSLAPVSQSTLNSRPATRQSLGPSKLHLANDNDENQFQKAALSRMSLGGPAVSSRRSSVGMIR